MYSASTTSLQSTAPSVSSTMPLRSSTPAKDYSAAFASLQTTYGFGPGPSQLATPSPVPKKQRKLRSLFRPSSSQTSSSSASSSSRLSPSLSSPHALPTRTPSPTQQKDYEAAFGKLSQSMGSSVPSSGWLL